MNSIDKKYLLLQFRDKVHQKNSTEFQTFFEDIAGMAFTDFIKVRPYGNQGDGGNDGYRPNEGVYYQVYSPINPNQKDADAAKKFKENFETLKANWDPISTIKSFNFVFNDKYFGTSIELEKATAELKKSNPSIEFIVFSAANLEDLFFTISSEDMIKLGFDIDSRNALKTVNSNLEKLEVELDRNNVSFVIKSLENIKTIVNSQKNETLLLEYELLEARSLQRLERVTEAKLTYESINARYPKEPRGFLYLAEIYLNDEDFDKNEEFIKKAESIDASHWLLPLQKLIRKIRQGNHIDTNKIDENSFPENPKLKADYYRLYSIFIENDGDITRSNSFIERAINFNPDKYPNYEIKLSHLEGRFLSERTDVRIKNKNAILLLEQIDEVEKKLDAWGGLTARNKAHLNVKRLHIFNVMENYPEYEKIAIETFNLILNCYFDYGVDRIICNIIQFIPLNAVEFAALLKYLSPVKKPISYTLAQMLFIQFMHKKSLFSEGKVFFEQNQKKSFSELISALEVKDYDKAVGIIKEDIQFMVTLIASEEMSSEFRNKLTKVLPDDGTINKEKLVFIDLYHEKNYTSAFKVLQTLDISTLSNTECIPMIEVAHKMKAWDFVVKLSEQLLQFETEIPQILKLELNLFTANLNVGRFTEVIRIGESLLSNPKKTALIDGENQEIILVQTSYAMAKRAKYHEARLLIDKYQTLLKKFETKVSVQTEVYLKDSDPEAALNSIIEAVKIKKQLTPEEYGLLFFFFTRIGSLMDYPLLSEAEVKLGSFIKIKNQERWLFIGCDDELDAIKVPEINQKVYLEKKVGEIVIIELKYSSQKIEHEIEFILPIGKYLLWQSSHYAQELSKSGMWDAMKAIEVPSTPEGGIDPKFLIKMLDDENKRGQDFFELYCEKNLPFALLAVSEGGLPQAIGKIQNEEKGFINFSDATQKELDDQKKVAEMIIAGQEFYLEGTSAVILSETGLLFKIHKFLPKIKTPQSVISLLLELIEKFTTSPGQLGFMFYSQGKVGITDIDATKHANIRQNFLDAIEILEDHNNGVEMISSANKSDKFSEQNVPGYLSDASILAQKNNIPVLTEDYLYLHMNELETSKPKPQYCSVWAILRVLYEQNKISFNEYLDFFGYVSSYRFKFLQLTIEDLEMAVLGIEETKIINDKGLKQLNIALTLSEEYGVPANVSHPFIARFFVKMLANDSVSAETMENIFGEIINNFPTKQDRQVFGRSLIIVSLQILKIERHNIIKSTNFQNKIDVLIRYIQMFDKS